MKKKPFYKRLWFIALVVICAIAIFANQGKTKQSSTTTADNTSSTQVEENTTTSTSTTTEMTTSNSTVFDPQDVSDATIESIQTYGDYLTMFDKIIEDYFAQYESVVQGTALYDQATFETMKQGYKNQLEQQREQYGAMEHSPIVGKDTIVQFLKEYRDNLQSTVDNLRTSLQ